MFISTVKTLQESLASPSWILYGFSGPVPEEAPTLRSALNKAMFGKYCTLPAIGKGVSSSGFSNRKVCAGQVTKPIGNVVIPQSVNYPRFTLNKYHVGQQAFTPCETLDGSDSFTQWVQMYAGDYLEFEFEAPATLNAIWWPTSWKVPLTLEGLVDGVWTPLGSMSASVTRIDFAPVVVTKVRAYVTVTTWIGGTPHFLGTQEQQSHVITHAMLVPYSDMSTSMANLSPGYVTTLNALSMLFAAGDATANAEVTFAAATVANGGCPSPVTINIFGDIVEAV